MPIYEYRCSSCGSRKEHLQKISDPRLTACPQCGKETYEKQLTAAGFQLKGSGWYVTDFRNGSSSGKESSTGSKDASPKDAPSGDASKDAGSRDSAGKDGAAKDTAAKDSTASPAPAATPAPSATPSTSTGS